MPVEHDERVRSFGTRVRLFPQAPAMAGFGEPEVVWLSPPAGEVRAGPSDSRIYVVDPIAKPDPYEFPDLPPYYGDIHPPAQPDADGHFDRLDVGSRAFLSAHSYGAVRRVLDIFESYLGDTIAWQFADRYEKLEVIPYLDWENAQSGYGFLELGYGTDEAGRRLPLALNFDVIAHEMGHAFLFSRMGLPTEEGWTPEFGGFHESAADLVAIVSAMHFDTILDRTLHATRGNIYTLNELNRIGEISDNRQIRIASNSRKMSEVTSEVHDLSRPLTGAFFDMIVEVYMDELKRRGLIGGALLDTARDDDLRAREAGRIQAAFDLAYKNRHFQFKSALMEARDAIGQRLIATWGALSPNDLTYSDVATAFLSADRSLSGERYQSAFAESFHWREIFESRTRVSI